MLQIPWPNLQLKHPSENQTLITTIILAIFLLVVLGVLTMLVRLYRRRKVNYAVRIEELKSDFQQAILQSELDIREKTLDYIARELHADFGHRASLINIHLSELLVQSTPDMHECIREAKTLAKQLTTGLAALSTSLRTDYIKDIGFAKALKNELTKKSATHRCSSHFNTAGTEYRLEAGHEIILFRMCQEVLDSMVRNDKGKQITVNVQYAPKTFMVQIVDDGAGVVDEEDFRYDMESVYKRSKMINAALNIENKPGEKLKVMLRIPLQN